MEPAASRRAFLVLGMHRSGTSALTRVLALHQVGLPLRLMTALPENPRGFWESPEITAFNDTLLHRLDGAWSEPSEPDLKRLSRSERAGLRKAALGLLRRLLPPDGDVVLKDPRLCRLLAVWLPAIKAYGAEPIGILAVRNPLEVAASLAARDDIPRSIALQLWLSHVLAAEAGTRGIRRVVVHYEDLLRNWRVALQVPHRVFGLGLPHEAELDAFLEAALRHNHSDTDTLLRDPAVPAAVKRVYAELRRAPAESGLDPLLFDQARRDLAALRAAR